MTQTKVASVSGTGHPPSATDTERVADVLERELKSTIQEWSGMVEKEPQLTRIKLTFEQRTLHLQQLLQAVIDRLRLDPGTRAPVSVAACQHGELRRSQGYTAAMVVNESRILQVCIFSTLHRNEKRMEYSKLLPDVVTIADEVDRQLEKQVICFLPADGALNKAATN